MAKFLSGRKTNLKLGITDHTVNDTACIVSIALGAKIIEKHFTLDKTLKGPDHSCSSRSRAAFSSAVNSILTPLTNLVLMWFLIRKG